jgi:hypothetical protein
MLNLSSHVLSTLNGGKRAFLHSLDLFWAPENRRYEIIFVGNSDDDSRLIETFCSLEGTDVRLRRFSWELSDLLAGFTRERILLKVASAEYRVTHRQRLVEYER